MKITWYGGARVRVAKTSFLQSTAWYTGVPKKTPASAREHDADVSIQPIALYADGRPHGVRFAISILEKVGGASCIARQVRADLPIETARHVHAAMGEALALAAPGGTGGGA